MGGEEVGEGQGTGGMEGVRMPGKGEERKGEGRRREEKREEK